MKKNETLLLRVESLGSDAQGICRLDGKIIFVPGALAGEQVEVLMVKDQRDYAYAKLLRVVELSPQRQVPPCPVYGPCGGCACQHMDYQASLAFKRGRVVDCLHKIGGILLDVPPVIGMDDPWHYRNKTAMPVAAYVDGPRSGFYRRRSHDIVPVESCLVAMEPSNTACQAVMRWMRKYNIPAYDERTHQGLVRHLITRVNRRGQSMVVLAVNGDRLPQAHALADELRQALPDLGSLCITPNTRGDNVILGSQYQALWGSATLEDTLCGLSFQLSPLSFFQINPLQAERLYDQALAFAALRPTDRVVDLYCGAGTISLLLARHAAQVTGIENVPQAIADAQQNARRNGVENVVFHCGTAETVLPRLVAEGMMPDVIVLDPPRKGADAAVLQAIARSAPRRVVYVSCDPATQARDAKVLTQLGYHAAACQSVDMFCQTPDIENVLLFERSLP